MPSWVIRWATAIAGVLGIVLPNIGVFHLPVAVEATITSVGGVILSILVFLEHPNVANLLQAKGASASGASVITSTKA